MVFRVQARVPFGISRGHLNMGVSSTAKIGRLRGGSSD